MLLSEFLCAIHPFQPGAAFKLDSWLMKNSALFECNRENGVVLAISTKIGENANKMLGNILCDWCQDKELEPLEPRYQRPPKANKELVRLKWFHVELVDDLFSAYRQCADTLHRELSSLYVGQLIDTVGFGNQPVSYMCNGVSKPSWRFTVRALKKSIRINHTYWGRFYAEGCRAPNAMNATLQERITHDECLKLISTSDKLKLVKSDGESQVPSIIQEMKIG